MEKQLGEWEGRSLMAQCTVAGTVGTAAAAGALLTAGLGIAFYRVHVAATSIVFKQLGMSLALCIFFW